MAFDQTRGLANMCRTLLGSARLFAQQGGLLQRSGLARSSPCADGLQLSHLTRIRAPLSSMLGRRARLCASCLLLSPCSGAGHALMPAKA